MQTNFAQNSLKFSKRHSSAVGILETADIIINNGIRNDYNDSVEQPSKPGQNSSRYGVYRR